MQLDTKQLKKIAILYVEDDESVRNQTVELFQRIFKEVYTAADGKEGVALFEKNQQNIDIIVTDINMPNLNGLDMIRQINTIAKNTPVIITTAHDDTKYLKSAMDLSVDKYITKPIQVRELTISIVDLVNKYQKINKIEVLAKTLIEKNNNDTTENEQLKQKTSFQETELLFYKNIVEDFVFFLQTDKQGKIQKASKKFCAFFDLSDDEIVQKDINSLKCGSCKGELLQQLMLKAIHSKKTVSSEQTFVTNGGKKFLFEVYIVPKYGSNMLVNGYTFYLDLLST